MQDLNVNQAAYQELIKNGNIHQQQHQLAKALRCYKQAQQIIPESMPAYFYQGVCYMLNHQPINAITCYEQALSINSNAIEVMHNLGKVYWQIGKLSQAETIYQRLLQLEPSHIDARYNYALVLKTIGDTTQAIMHLEAVLNIDPHYKLAGGLLIELAAYLCDWSKVAYYSANAAYYQAVSPFTSLWLKDNLQENLDDANKVAKQLCDNITKFVINRRTKKEIINIGYLSNDFHDHPTAHLILRLFELHNRNKFKVFIYSYSPHDTSDYRLKIEHDVDVFHDISSMSDFDAATLINQNEIDILVDLKGYTQGARLEILAMHPAPIQISYLGFPGSLGEGLCEYIITDKFVTPLSMQPYYAEILLHMPHCYQITNDHQPIANQDYTRDDFKIPKQAFCFASFNQSYKITQQVFTAWCHILNSVEHSVLWLYVGKSLQVKFNLQQAFIKKGLSIDRLIFADQLPKHQHLARLALADLVLDTWNYNGHTTTSDALYAGVPVLTLQGKNFSSRVASSLLQALDLLELITNSKAEYINMAINLATNSDKISAVRDKIALNNKSSNLFASEQWVRDYEALLLSL